MFGKGGRAAKKNTTVWLLGRDHPGADRSLEWDGSFGNLSDPDVVIVDLTALTEQILRSTNKTELDQAQKSIESKLLYGGTVVAITQPKFSIPSRRPLEGSPASPYGGQLLVPYRYSNYHILPIDVVTTVVQANHVIRAGDKHRFKGYIDAVKGYNFVIDSVTDKIPPDPTGAPPATLLQLWEWDITDNSGRVLGLELEVAKSNHHGRLRQAPGPGRLVLLPPPTEQIDEAIGRILSVYKASPPAGAPPAWAERLSPGPAGENRKRIAELEGRKAKIQGEIDDLARRNDRILAHRRLLYSDGAELEDAVVEAFRALGFGDIERMGNRDEEDASFGMGGGGGGGTLYSRCAIEAKGAGKGTKMRHILQCSRWAEQRAAAEGRPVKGVFVPNQHRLKPYPGSLEIRTRIEDDQLKHAELKDICIIPSCVLFEAVSGVLGGETPSRAGIAGKIAATKGVLKDVL